MSDQTNQIVIADRDMLVRMWLTEAVATGKMTQAAADKHWKGYSDNWHTVANYFSATDDAMLIRKLVQETGIRGRCYFKRYNGKLHVVFKGYPGLRRVLTGTKYGALHPKVVGLGDRQGRCRKVGEGRHDRIGRTADGLEHRRLRHPRRGNAWPDARWYRRGCQQGTDRWRRWLCRRIGSGCVGDDRGRWAAGDRRRGRLGRRLGAGRAR